MRFDVGDKYKPIVCVDWDGVIHSYTSGWKGAAIITDGPVPGAMEFIYNAVEHFRVAIYSSRSHQPGGIDAMRAALRMWLTAAIDDGADSERVFALIEWPTEKSPALLTIDDRALTFTGRFPSIEEIREFKPWNKKSAAEQALGASAQDLIRWLTEAELLTCKIWAEDAILMAVELSHAERPEAELEFEVRVAGGIHDGDKRWLAQNISVSRLIETQGAALIEEINLARDLAMAGRAKAGDANV